MARKILLADDSVTAQNMGRKILADAGYEVITVNNGSAALKKIGEQKPDLIVLDVYMPGYSGLEVCQRLKDAGETARIPVLLTVGKLEPFKPEEAKRVRADGFIVKPFEASELLSAVSKMEDKIVPRAEPSKPGRFARATAAVEESRYDKTVAIDEDSGWKNRIAFPSKKKKKEESAAPEDVDDVALYNPVNKDLRTVIDHKVTETPHPAKTEEDRVDLGALAAAAGLPKDVTPEEIAALAAAAAQVKGIETPKIEVKEEAQPAPEVTAAASPAVVVAEAKPWEKVEAKEDVPVAADHAAEIPASATTEHESGKIEDATSANGSAVHKTTEETLDEPVTMARVASDEPTVVASSRWTAVSAPLTPEEAGISLEQEMQKAYAASAAAESTPAATVAAIAETAPESVAAADSAPSAEPPISETTSPVPASTALESSPALETVATVTTDAVSATVAEPEAVVASVEQTSAAASDAPAAYSEPSSQFVPETQQKTETEVEPVRPSAAAVWEEKTVEAETVEAVTATAHEDGESTETKQEPAAEVPVPSAIAAPTDQDSVSQASSDTRAAALAEPAAKETSDTGKDSEIAATTAAAWASWRRIRESGNSSTDHSPDANHGDQSPSTPPDSAAMAVAVGAQSNPSDVPAASEDSGEIASIVDSVLADLRPKIVEEISRKLGKKK